MNKSLLDQLIDAFTCLPGIGPKSAQRMTFYLLERNRNGGEKLGHTLLKAMNQIQHCQQCRNFCEQAICQICSNLKRDHSQLCIVETPADVLAIEQTGYRGYYFVLMGHLSPLDGIGPKEIGMDLLKDRLQDIELEEIILATNPTIEGEATAHYIAELAKNHTKSISRIAHGVPLGGELEYIDGGTLSHALNYRRQVL